jgi:hypothetical protein
VLLLQTIQNKWLAQVMRKLHLSVETYGLRRTDPEVSIESVSKKRVAQ